MNQRGYILSTQYVPYSELSAFLKHIMQSSQVCEAGPVVTPILQMRKGSLKEIKLVRADLGVETLCI